MDKNKIIEAAYSYLDVPYHHQGRNRAGIDCVGLPIAIARDIGYPLTNDQYAYEQIPNPETLYGGLEENFTRVHKAEPGDILVMRFHIEPQHTAIFTGGNIIHSYEKAGKVVKHRFSNAWQARVLRVYRYGQ